MRMIIRANKKNPYRQQETACSAAESSGDEDEVFEVWVRRGGLGTEGQSWLAQIATHET